MAPRMYWSSQDVSKLKSFIISQKDILLPIFYQNILNGCIKLRKPSGFFKKMSQYVSRTTDQCKSKFQKFEKEIYTKYLKVPSKDFFVFVWIQKNKDINQKVRNYWNKKSNESKESNKIENNSQFDSPSQIKDISSRYSDANVFKSHQDHFENSSSESGYDDTYSSTSENQTEDDLIRHWQKIVDNVKKTKRIKEISGNPLI